ncbi:formate dehydrogenase subunit gamma [Pelomonas sp. CA6]|uniref:formate dehydrogenase subunit gamma n=1 Tax=Pelomonas sp. CA6 TaxID=2907999 RepID=UPI001F4BF269|nr:formate dehydrogenase subunit gamma [Pelomonas sp. CA6]MCH7343947.1 formate dehydrogenase subunit gamma [Pelomonas sp. CA6]
MPATASPASLELPPGRLEALIETHRHQPGALLPLLHAIQDELGHIPDAAVAPIAEALQLSRAEVHGVITYYHFFRREPAGRHVLQVCRAESCQACGAEALLAQAGRALECGVGQTRADGAVTLEPVYCLGLCSLSPALMLDGRLHARVTPERLDGLLEALR